MSTGQGKIKSLVVLSGGLDSAVALAVSERGPGSAAIAFDYGQNNKIELDCAQELAGRYGVPLIVEDISSHGKLLNFGMTRPGEKVNSEFGPNRELPSSYVPARNLVFLSLALSLAEARMIEKVVVGFIHGQWTHDASMLFVHRMNTVAEIACDKFVPQIHAPLLCLSKQGVVRLGQSLGVPFELTWSCHNAPYKTGSMFPQIGHHSLACGECGACRSRYWAFKACGSDDPVQYYTIPKLPE